MWGEVWGMLRGSVLGCCEGGDGRCGEEWEAVWVASTHFLPHFFSPSPKPLPTFPNIRPHIRPHFPTPLLLSPLTPKTLPHTLHTHPIHSPTLLQPPKSLPTFFLTSPTPQHTSPHPPHSPHAFSHIFPHISPHLYTLPYPSPHTSPPPPNIGID